MPHLLRPALVACLSLAQILASAPVRGQSTPRTDPPYLTYQARWVDSVMRTLSPDERIGQLIMVAAYSNRGPGHTDTLINLVRQHRVGGLVFFQGGPVRQARLTNYLQARAKVPLWVAMDAEWGVAMRLDSTVRFPYQTTLGAMPADQTPLIYQMGAEIARQFKRLGMHVNFAPSVDVNNNPNNPVINFRSFGENKYAVTEKAAAYVQGMQDNRILTTLKHFPGHGDTDADSHYALPLIAKSRAQLDSLELYPFRELTRRGAGGVMVAHLSIPALDSTPNLPSTLSRPIVGDLLRRDVGFRGLVFTDAMNMRGVTKFFAPGLADVKAILAGNDVLEFSADVPKAIAQIKEAIRRGELTQADVDARCRKVLAAKLWVGLDHYQPIDLNHLTEDLNTPAAALTVRRMLAASLTVLRNTAPPLEGAGTAPPLEGAGGGFGRLPLQRLDTLRVASLSLGSATPTPFQQMLANYTTVAHFNLTDQSPPAEVARVRGVLAQYNTVLVGVHGLNVRPARNYGLTPALAALVNEFAALPTAITCLFTNAYVINKLTGLDQARGLLLTYQDSPVAQELAAQAIFGAIGTVGRLPVTVSPSFKYGEGLTLAPLQRLGFGPPEAAGLDGPALTRRIDSLAGQALAAKATPGCVVLVAKDGQVVFQKAYGYHTYDQSEPMQLTDVFDLASLTKVSASLPALMRLRDAGKFDLDKTFADYLPRLFRRSNKKALPFRQILTHQAQLKAWIPFWKDALEADGKTFKHRIFRADSSRRFPIKVADDLFLRRKYPKKIYRQIIDSPLNDKPGYVYSDLSYYFYPQLVQQLSGQDFETYLKQHVYAPIGANSLTFNAWQHFPMARIVPTEYDSLFRKVLIRGRVHDEGAAMLNGLSGHAGLFGSAGDLAKLMQLYLQGGTYGGERLISAATLAEFERCQFCPDNRRALGFDRPAETPAGNVALSASAQSFGHSGFTGTFAWVDPAHNLVYIFMSNRVYPTRNNPKLYDLNTRTAIQQAIYDSLAK